MLGAGYWEVDIVVGRMIVVKMGTMAAVDAVVDEVAPF